MTQAPRSVMAVVERIRLALPILLSLLACRPQPVGPASGGTQPQRATGAAPGESPAGPASDAARALARYKDATGGAAWDAIHTLHVRGTVAAGGLEGTFDTVENLPTGQYRSDFRLGPVSGSDGFDGAVSWTRDQSGSVHVSDAESARKQARNEAYRTARAFWFRDRWPAQIELRAPAGDPGGERFEAVAVEPRGGRWFTMWIDRATGLLDRTVEEGSNHTTTVHFSDYRPVGDIRLPHAIRISTGEPKYDQLLTVVRVEIDPEVAPERYALPKDDVSDFVIAGGGDSVTLPFELLNNHIYVQAMINGKGPVRMLVDTGGLNVLTPQAAESLGVAAEGAMEVRGAGARSVDMALARVDEIALGGAELRDQVFYVIDLGRLEQVERVPVAGLVGFEVFKRFTVTVDYAARKLTLGRPEASSYRGAGEIVPFVFNGRTPQVAGTLDGVPGMFTVDTGSRASLTLHAPFVDQHGLMAKYAPEFQTTTGWGVGGSVKSHPARAGRFTMAGVTLDDVVVDLFTGGKGAFAAKDIAGNVGGEILRRFTLIIDYHRQRLIFEKNGAFARPGSYDRAGMWLNRDGGGLLVEDVVAGGPAAQAGLQTGDRIVAIDGKPVAGASLSGIRERLRTSPPGTRVRVRLLRAKRPIKATVVLRDLI